AARVFWCISATTRPAWRILAISCGSRLMLAPFDTRASGSEGLLSNRSGGTQRSSEAEPVAVVPAAVDGPDQSVGDVVGGPHAVDGHQLVALEVPGDQGLGLLLVQGEPAPDGGLGVVLPLDDLATAHVARPVVLGRRGRRVVGPAG